MAYHPRYRLSAVVLKAAEELAAARAVVELLPLPFAQVRQLRRAQEMRLVLTPHPSSVELLQLENSVRERLYPHRQRVDVPVIGPAGTLEGRPAAPGQPACPLRRRVREDVWNSVLEGKRGPRTTDPGRLG